MMSKSHVRERYKYVRKRDVEGILSRLKIVKKTREGRTMYWKDDVIRAFAKWEMAFLSFDKKCLRAC